MAQVIETVFSIRTEESIANLNEVVGALGRTEAAGKKAAKGVSDEMAKIPKETKKATSGFNGLANSINQVSRELPAFAFSAQTGFLAISNNLPILADEITALRKANEALAAQGKATIPVWKQVASSLFDSAKATVPIPGNSMSRTLVPSILNSIIFALASFK